MTTQVQYQEIPELGISVATKPLYYKIKESVGCIWYKSKLWVQERGLALPTSRQLSEIKDRLESSLSETAYDHRPDELTDSLVAWPNVDGKYASNLNPEPEPGKYPLLIEGSIVHRIKGRYIIDGGNRIELPNFPTKDGILENPIPESGLTGGAFLFTYPDFSFEEGLRPIVRGFWLPIALEKRRNAYADHGPSEYIPNASFRPIVLSRK